MFNEAKHNNGDEVIVTVRRALLSDETIQVPCKVVGKYQTYFGKMIEAWEYTLRVLGTNDTFHMSDWVLNAAIEGRPMMHLGDMTDPQNFSPWVRR